MTRLKSKIEKSETEKELVSRGETSGFFNDNYTDPDIKPEDEDAADPPLSLEELNRAMQRARDLISSTEELFDAGDYEEALPLLLQSYELLTEIHHSLLFEEVTTRQDHVYWMARACFRIAFCYMETDDYVSAYFYIDLVREVNIDCFMEWVNVLVLSRRMDALGVVEAYLENPELLDHVWEDDEKEKKTVMDFLERRRGFLLIEYGELEKARELFTRLLDNPACRKFAQEELDYIDGL